jgi:hypothetical protein
MSAEVSEDCKNTTDRYMIMQCEQAKKNMENGIICGLDGKGNKHHDLSATHPLCQYLL